MGDLIPLNATRGTAERWLNKRQAAQHLGVSIRWVEYRQANDSLPFRRVGGMNFYRASELDAWLLRHA